MDKIYFAARVANLIIGSIGAYVCIYRGIRHHMGKPLARTHSMRICFGWFIVTDYATIEAYYLNSPPGPRTILWLVMLCVTLAYVVLVKERGVQLSDRG